MAKRAEDIIGFRPLPKKQELDFDPEVMTLTQILNNNTLPKVIRCDESNVPPKEDTNYIDLSQPVLIYCKNSVRKVCAQNLTYDKQKQMFQPVGSDLLIPDTYLGWFAVMGSPEDYTTDQPVPHYRTLAQLATSQCTEFLVGGSKPIEGIVMDKSMSKNIRCNILPGDVLKKAGNYVAQYSNDEKKKHKKKKKVKGKEKSQQEEVYIKCFDRQDREIFIPANQMGIFFVVAQNSKLKSQVMQMPSILERYKFPLIVTLIYGMPPKVPCAFTGTLLLTDSGMSHTVVASTLFNIKNINFEIPLSSNLKFHVAVENPGLRGCSDYIKALKSCESNAQSYMRNIKVIIGDPKFENDMKSGSKGNTQASEQTELRSSQKGQKSPSTPSNDKKAHLISRGSRKSTFKDLSTRLTINTDTDSLGETTSSSTGFLRSEEFLTSSPKLQRNNAYDPPEPSHTIPILSGSKSLAQLSTPQAHEYELATLKPTSTSLKGDYIKIWPINKDNPPPKPHFLDDLGYLISPRYKEDIHKDSKQGGDLPNPHPHVAHRSLSNPAATSSVPKQRLRDLKSSSLDNGPESTPSSDLHSTNNYINFIPQSFDRIEDLTSVERFSQISMGDDYDVPPPLPVRKQFSNGEYLTSTSSLSTPQKPALHPAISLPITPDHIDPYERPNTLNLRNIKLDTPETFKAGQGRDANSGIVDSGIYVEEDPPKDENDNVTGAQRNPNNYISMCEALPLLIKPMPATKDLNSPPRPGSDSKIYLTNPNGSRNSPPPITFRSISLAGAVDLIGKKNILIKDIQNSGVFLSKSLELSIMNLTQADFSHILHEKQNMDNILIKIFPQVSQYELNIIAQCLQNMNL